MLLTIYNLPSRTQYRDIKELVYNKCGLQDLIFDKLVRDGDYMKVTVGVAEDHEAALLMQHIDGLHYKGKQLYIKDSRQKKESAPPQLMNCQPGQGFQYTSPIQYSGLSTCQQMSAIAMLYPPQNVQQPYMQNLGTPLPVPSPFTLGAPYNEQRQQFDQAYQQNVEPWSINTFPSYARAGEATGSNTNRSLELPTSSRDMEVRDRGNARDFNRGNFSGRDRDNNKDFNSGNFSGNDRGNARDFNRGNFSDNHRDTNKDFNRDYFSGSDRDNIKDFNKGNFSGNDRGNARDFNRGNFSDNHRDNNKDFNRGNFSDTDRDSGRNFDQGNFTGNSRSNARDYNRGSFSGNDRDNNKDFSRGNFSDNHRDNARDFYQGNVSGSDRKNFSAYEDKGTGYDHGKAKGLDKGNVGDSRRYDQGRRSPPLVRGGSRWDKPVNTQDVRPTYPAFASTGPKNYPDNPKPRPSFQQHRSENPRSEGPKKRPWEGLNKQSTHNNDMPSTSQYSSQTRGGEVSPPNKMWKGTPNDPWGPKQMQKRAFNVCLIKGVNQIMASVAPIANRFETSSKPVVKHLWRRELTDRAFKMLNGRNDLRDREVLNLYRNQYSEEDDVELYYNIEKKISNVVAEGGDISQFLKPEAEFDEMSQFMTKRKLKQAKKREMKMQQGLLQACQQHKQQPPLQKPYQPPENDDQPPPKQLQPPPKQLQPAPKQHQPPPKQYQPPPKQHQPPPKQYQPPRKQYKPPPKQNQPQQNHPQMKIPPHPNGDLKAHKQMKRASKLERQTMEAYPMVPIMEKAVEEELSLLCEIAQTGFDNPENEQARAVYNNVDQIECIEQIKKFYKHHLSKRITNEGIKLVRIHGQPKLPSRDDLEKLLLKYRCQSLSRSKKTSNLFIATFGTYEMADKVVALNRVEMVSNNGNPCSVEFKYMHLAPEKPKLNFTKIRSMRKNHVKNQIETSEVNLLDKNWPEQIKQSEKVIVEKVDDSTTDNTNKSVNEENVNSTAASVKAEKAADKAVNVEKSNVTLDNPIKSGNIKPTADKPIKPETSGETVTTVKNEKANPKDDTTKNVENKPIHKKANPKDDATKNVENKPIPEETGNNTSNQEFWSDDYQVPREFGENDKLSKQDNMMVHNDDDVADWDETGEGWDETGENWEEDNTGQIGGENNTVDRDDEQNNSTQVNADIDMDNIDDDDLEDY